jgi:hypothetical protein
MKHCLVTLAALLVAASTYAQGTVNFNNKITGSVDARVTIQGSGAPVDNTWWGQLYASAPGGTLAAVGDPIAFRSTPAAGQGYLNTTGIDTTRTIPGVAEGGTASVKMVAWSSAAGATYAAASGGSLGGWGESGVITVATGGGLTPPGALTGLTAFTVLPVVPEPSIAALGLLGAGLLLIRRKK